MRKGPLPTRESGPSIAGVGGAGIPRPASLY